MLRGSRAEGLGTIEDPEPEPWIPSAIVSGA